MEVPGYRVGEEFARSGPHVLCRGWRSGDELPVLLKATVRTPPPALDREGLEHEFALLARVAVDGVPRALDLVRSSQVTCLVLEDRGLVPVRRILAAGSLDVGSFCSVAIELCTVLGELHRRRVTHGGLSPSSLLVSADFSVLHLLGVGSASSSFETRTPADASAATYLSPEQTGRINRVVDYRADFYALGVTFYELLTGRPPFVSDDPLQLMHAHIARTPVPPAAVNGRIPEPLSRLVLRLLAKGAEDRYQSAIGIRRDLERCRSEWTVSGSISSFALGEHDVSDRLRIPDKLYGRDREVAELGRVFEQTCLGSTELLLVAGYPGIGKTALIEELYHPTVARGGYFITGKFDQVVRNVPYGALTQAFRGLVSQLLTESEKALSQWRAELMEALGANGGVLADVIPEIELIIGRQPEPPPLEPTEARNRFGYVFQGFVRTLARKEHPLVVFLDDLQWVDAATMELLHTLVTTTDIRHLLLVGAYRDNEVTDDHLLLRVLGRMESAGARVTRLPLGSLSPVELTRFLCDTLGGAPAAVGPLARLIQHRTDGNPFSVIQFLKTLEQDGLVALDPERAVWVFDMAAIEKTGLADNVIDLMATRIRRLSISAQQALALAACVGNPFDHETLVTISRQGEQAIAASLSEALDAGLIQRASHRANVSGDPRTSYAFVHDRVQLAAYDLIAPADKKSVHLDVGRTLLATMGAAAPDDRLFSILNHLNIGGALITASADALEVARLNLTAGRKAKTSAAYRAAVEYFGHGIALLDEASWDTHPELMLALHVEKAECEYLAGAFDLAERSFQSLLDRTLPRAAQAQVHGMRVTLYENQSRWADAVSAGRAGLALFGLQLPETEAAKQEALDREVDGLARLLDGRSIGSLVDLPEMTDPAMRMVLRILTIVWAPAYISGDELLARLISATIVRLSLVGGNTEDSAYGYVTHAITIGPIRGDYASAYQWGELALHVNGRFGDLKHRAKIYQQFQAHVNLWCRPFASCISYAREACRSGLEGGDFAYAGYGAATEAWPALLTSNDLDAFVREYVPTLALLDSIKMRDFHAAHRVVLNWARALQARTASPGSLSDPSFDELSYVRTYEGAAPFFLTFIYVARLHLSVLLGDVPAALDAARRARRVAVAGTVWPVFIEFWGGLAAAMAIDMAPGEATAEHLRELVRARDAMIPLAQSCPVNFRCSLLLLSAEIERVTGQREAARRSCDDAVRYARETANRQMEALAREMEGRMAIERADAARARASLTEAYHCYAAWGATAKLAQMTQRYRRYLPGLQEVPLLEREQQTDAPGPLPTALDVSTVLKVAHAMAVEIEMAGLLAKLMKLAIENAGAGRGVFLLDTDGVLTIEAVATADSDNAGAGTARPGSPDDDVAVTVVRYVQRTGHDVVIGNAAADQRFPGDSYIARSGVKSILCVPVARQGRLGGILYLENSLTTEAFTAAGTEMMRVLAAQTAISLENARLYEGMKIEIARRTAAERALTEALSEVEALKDRLEAENVYLQEEIRNQHNFNEIIGNSPALLEALRRVERVAPTDATVLIVGETGSGKELFARAIHSRSRRSARPLVKVNCGAIAPGLVESELFGHVKGAFTGAIEKRTGRFELADGGTIFLDEVSELPLDAQVKLLRVLQEQEFEPVGSSRSVPVSVRVIAATNRDLEAAVRDGSFRADLLYRLNVFPLRVPPLRDRRSDLGVLVAFFSTALARKLGKPIEGVSARSMAAMAAYAWPGNVRELQNIIERAAILAPGPILELEESLLVPDQLTLAPPSPRRAERAASSRAGSLDEIQRRHILEVLKGTAGVIEGTRGAAAVLGLHPNTLRSRMKKLGIATAAHRAP